jgi:hypothetical protein
MGEFRPVYRLTTTHVRRAFARYDILGDAQCDDAVDVPPPVGAEAVVGMIVPHVVAEEVRHVIRGMGDQGLVLREVQLEISAQEVTQAGLDVLGFGPWADELRSHPRSARRSGVGSGSLGLPPVASVAV